MTYNDSRGMSTDVLAGIVWRKSSRSNGQGGECVEAANSGGLHLAHDSKNPGGPVLAFGCAAWRTFLDEVKVGRHDLT